MTDFYKTAIPAITWDGALNTDNIIEFMYPLDDWRVYSRAIEGSEFLQIESGQEDAWIVNTEYVLEGSVKFIVSSTTGSRKMRIGSGSNVKGWDDNKGWDEFLQYAREKNTFRFYPESGSAYYITSFLFSPIEDAPSLEPDGTRTIQLGIRNTSQSYDGY
jgi:hypothetical protein